MQAAEIKAALEAACAEREEVRGRLSAADRALSQARAESARRCSQNRTLLGKLAAAQVAAWHFMEICNPLFNFHLLFSTFHFSSC